MTPLAAAPRFGGSASANTAPSAFATATPFCSDTWPHGRSPRRIAPEVVGARASGSRAAPLVIAASILVVRQRRRRRRHDAIAHAGGGREHTVIREHHAARPWHERAEPFEERQRIEDDVGEAVAVALLQPVADTAIVEDRQSILDDRRPRGVAAQFLEPLATALGDAHCGVERESIEVTAQRTAVERMLQRAAARSQIVGAATFAERGAAGDRGGAEVQQQRWLAVDFARRGGVVIGRQLAVPAQRAADAAPDRAQQAHDVVVGDFGVRIEVGAASAGRAGERAGICTLPPSKALAPSNRRFSRKTRESVWYARQELNL